MNDIKIALISLQSAGDRVVPFGLVSLATYLEQKKGIKNIRIIDRNFENVRQKITEYRPDLIGISAMTILYSDAISCACELKNIVDVPIIVGGVHISTLPTSLKKCFDIGVIGEGEKTFSELVELYQIKKKFEADDLRNIQGLTFWNNERLEITDKKPPISILDEIPMPDYKYVNKRYFDEKPIIGLGEIKKIGWIITSRGCPYKCVFCSASQFWDKVRFHSAEYIANHVKYLIDEYGIRHIIIMDDLFTINKTRVREFIAAFKKKGILGKATLTAQARANTIDDEICELLKRFNVTILQFGFESGSKKILSYLKGHTITPEINFKAIRLVKKHGMKVFGSFMFGNPGETIEDMKETVKFIEKAKDFGIDYFFTFVATPFPATQFWKIAKEQKKVADDMDFKKLSHHAYSEPLLSNDKVSQEEFTKLFTKTRNSVRPLKYKMLYDIVRNNFWKTLFLNLKSPMFSLQKLYHFLYRR
jgi:radical SAM superfamily enzyme YgiQ (UPF0313 family)